MNAYENGVIGNIILMKNIVFTNNINIKKTHEIDHSWRTGRPCLIIYSDDEYDYFLPIKSYITDIKYQNHYASLNESNLLYKDINKLSKYNFKKNSNRVVKGYINFETIYKTPVSWHEGIGKISFEKYKEIIDEIKEYYKLEDLNTVFKEAKTIK